MSTLIDRLKLEMKRRDVSVPKLSIAIKIPKGRLYKWLDGTNNPKENDTEKLEDWIKREKKDATNLTVRDDEIEYQRTPSQTEVIQLLKDKVSLLEQMNEFLKKEVVSEIKKVKEIIEEKQ